MIAHCLFIVFIIPQTCFYHFPSLNKTFLNLKVTKDTLFGKPLMF
jgi:hypothetical protein